LGVGFSFFGIARILIPLGLPSKGEDFLLGRRIEEDDRLRKFFLLRQKSKNGNNNGFSIFGITPKNETKKV
jgi:hypothetical protein